MPYFLRRGRRVELSPLPRTFVVRGPGAALDRLAALLPPGAEVVATDDAVIVVAGDEAVIRRAATLPGARLEGARVEPAYRQEKGPADDLWAPTGRVAVRFPEDWGRDRIDAVLSARGLKVEEPLDGTLNGYFASTPGDPIEAARALVEEDGAVFAEPDFIRKMRLRGHPHGVAPRTVAGGGRR
jgi:hypothetical protein